MTLLRDKQRPAFQRFERPPMNGTHKNAEGVLEAFWGGRIYQRRGDCHWQFKTAAYNWRDECDPQVCANLDAGLPPYESEHPAPIRFQPQSRSFPAIWRDEIDKGVLIYLQRRRKLTGLPSADVVQPPLLPLLLPAEASPSIAPLAIDGEGQGVRSDRKIWTWGYTGKKPAQLKQIAESEDAVVFDIRYSPFSRFAAYWRKDELINLLGARYRHVQSWGNSNYRTKGGEIMILNYHAGKAALDKEPRNVILLCACAEARTCHRTIVADMLRRDGYNVLGEYAPPAPAAPAQMQPLL